MDLLTTGPPISGGKPCPFVPRSLCSCSTFIADTLTHSASNPSAPGSAYINGLDDVHINAYPGAPPFQDATPRMNLDVDLIQWAGMDWSHFNYDTST